MEGKEGRHHQDHDTSGVLKNKVFVYSPNIWQLLTKHLLGQVFITTIINIPALVEVTAPESWFLLHVILSQAWPNWASDYTASPQTEQ